MSPTEPEDIRRLFRSSSLPENYGADFLITTGRGLVGVQRKEINDFAASVMDGRLSTQIAKLHSLNYRALLIEGRILWTRDSYFYGNISLSRSMFISILTSLQLDGTLVYSTLDKDETCNVLMHLGQYFTKSHHTFLSRRPKPSPEWGKVTNTQYSLFLLQSFPGVGPQLARRILDKFGTPLKWSVSIEDLMTVEGIGKERAKRILSILD